MHFLSLSGELDNLVKNSTKEQDKLNAAKKKLLSLHKRSQELGEQLVTLKFHVYMTVPDFKQTISLEGRRRNDAD